ncbi:hypothetical protein ACFLSY_11180 [Bacteroidota bacterium]
MQLKFLEDTFCPVKEINIRRNKRPRPLPEKLRKSGFSYTLILRGKRSLIYEQRVTPNTSYFEVFIIRIKPEVEIFGKIIPEREVFPGNEDFGYGAWSIRDYKNALLKFKKLEDGRFNSRENNYCV